MKPVMADMKAKYPGIVIKFVEFHAADAQPVVKAFEIQSHPQLILLSPSGRLLDQERGYRLPEQVEGLLQRYYPKSTS